MSKIETEHFPKKVLKLQRTGVMKEKELHKNYLIVEKHISLFPLDEDRALYLSNNRKQFTSETGKMVVKNHVFEDPKVLIKAIVVDPTWKECYNKEIFVSKQKLKLIQSEKDKKTSNWTAKEIDPRHAMFADKSENFHLLTEFLSYDEIKFVAPGDKDGERADQLKPSRKRGSDNAPKMISISTNKFSLLSDNNEE